MKLSNALMILAIACSVSILEAQADTQGLVLSTGLKETPHTACLSRENAVAEAGGLALKTAQAYCRSEGFGWRAAAVKDLGQLDCHRCDNGQYSCGHTHVALECRKAEPKLTWLGWISGTP